MKINESYLAFFQWLTEILILCILM